MPESLNIIGLLGEAGAGKDTAGKYLCDIHPGVTLAFAGKLKEICGEMFDLSSEDVNTEAGKSAPSSFPCFKCPRCGSTNVESVTLDRDMNGECKLCGTLGEIKVFKGTWTPRAILQHVGTEGFRAVDPNVWARYAINQARQILKAKKPPRFVVITDVRFRSEVEAIWKVGGAVWRIQRPEADGAATDGGIKGHASEAEQATIPSSELQAVVVNDGSLETLRARLRAPLSTFLSSR